MITNYWHPASWFSLGDIFCVSETKSMVVLHINSPPLGMSGLIEPIWPNRIGDQVVDNTITWVCIKETPLMPIIIQQDSIFKPELELVLVDLDYIEEREV